MRVRSNLTRPWETITTTTKTNNGDICLLLSRQLHCFTIAVKRTAIDPIWIMTGLDKTKHTASEWPDMVVTGLDKTKHTALEWPDMVVTGLDKTKHTALEWHDMSGDWCGQDKTCSLRMTQHECMVTGVDKKKGAALEWPDISGDWFGQDKTYSLRMTRHEWWLVWTRHHVRNKHSGRHWKPRTYPLFFLLLFPFFFFFFFFFYRLTKCLQTLVHLRHSYIYVTRTFTSVCRRTQTAQSL